MSRSKWAPVGCKIGRGQVGQSKDTPSIHSLPGPHALMRKVLLVTMLSIALCCALFGKGDLSTYNQALNKATVAWDARKLTVYMEASREMERLAEASGDPRLKAESYLYLGRGYGVLPVPEFPKATAYLEKSLKWSHEIGDLRLQARNLFSLGFFSNKQDRTKEALAYFREAEKKSETAGDKARQAWALVNIGEIYWMKLNHYSKAGECFARALELSTEANDAEAISASYRSLGEIRALSGDVDQAIGFFEKAGEASGLSLTMREAIFTSMGSAYDKKGDYKAALDYYQQALAVMEKDEARTDLNVLIGLMGETYLKMGALEKAEEYFKKALKLSKKLGRRQNEGFCLKDLGDVATKRGKLKEAEKHYEAALTIGRGFGFEDLEWEALEGLGELSRMRNDQQKAREYYEKAIELIEAVRRRLTVREGAEFWERKLGIYEKLVELLLSAGGPQKEASVAVDRIDSSSETRNSKPETRNSGFAALAFYYSEKGKGQALLELVTRGRLFENLKIDDELRSRLRDIQSAIKTKRQEVGKKRENVQELWKKAPSPGQIKEREKQIRDSEIELEKLEREESDIVGRIRQTYPNYSRIYEPQALTLKEVQNELHDGEVLIEYMVMEKKTIVFIVGNHSFAYEELPLGRGALREKIAGLEGPFANVGATANKGRSDILTLMNIRLDQAQDLYETIFQPIETKD